MNGKRTLDLLLVIPGLIVLSPLFLLFGIWIKIDSPGPVFFRQERVGKDGRYFQIYKFRTMVVNAESSRLRLTVGEDSRITRNGRILRKYKLDELPQLINVFKGEMSLVGPRPEVPEYVRHYPENIRTKVLSVPPGITDFAAIEFRDENRQLASTDDPHRLYLESILPTKLSRYQKYVDERSVLLDLKLIIKTLVVLIRRG